MTFTYNPLVMNRILLLLIVSFLFATSLNAQKNDTILISEKMVDTKVLKPGIHRWLIYFKMGKDSSRTRYQLWTRKIDRIQYKGKTAISVTQEWENNDSVFHTAYTVCDFKNFAPLFQETWSKSGRMEFDFQHSTMKVNGKIIDAGDTSSANLKKRLAFEKTTSQYILDWHLDLEVFAILPYQEHRTFMINFYDPGFSEPKLIPYTVAGSESLTGYDNQLIDCWILEQSGKISTDKYWISKKTREVLKLEQAYGGKYRYKVKLPFSK